MTTNAIDVVITSYNQGQMVQAAVASVLAQTVLPQQLFVVDDGSDDEASWQVLAALAAGSWACPVHVVRQPNAGVSAARNAGLRRATAPLVLVMDGDDQLAPDYLVSVSALLAANPQMVAASSWLATFGVLAATVKPTGGDITAFLPRNACPATYLLRRAAFLATAGYDEAMRRGFEDWDFFLSLLETAPRATIGIVPAPLLRYRTAPASANITSMTHRLDLMRGIIEKHRASYQTHLTEALLGIEATSTARLAAWEQAQAAALAANGTLSPEAAAFLASPSYGDGGMASAVRLATRQAEDRT